MRPPGPCLGGCLLAAALGAFPLGLARAQIAAAPPGGGAVVPTERRTAALSWVRLPGATACASAAEMARRVEGILKREALVPPARADLSAEVRVERVPARRRFRAVIQVADAQGKVVGDRTIETSIDDCHRLDEPVALAIALMIDPDAMTRIPEPPPPPPPPIIAVRRDVVFVPVQVEAPPPPPPPAPEPEPEAPSFAIAVGPTLAMGLLPGPAAGARVAVELGPPAELDPEGLAWAPPSLRLGFAGYGGSLELQGSRADQRATLTIGALLPRVEACPTTAWAHARLAFGVCAALDVGVLTWTGSGFDSPVASGTRAAVDLGPLAHLRLLIAPPLSLEVRGAAVVPLVRDRFVYERPNSGSGLAYEPGAVAATLDAGLHLGFDP